MIISRRIKPRHATRAFCVMEREEMEYDVCIVGAGPAGLSAAIRLKQQRPETNVCVLEKGSEVGAHILSGNCFVPTALNELIPDWKEKGAPLNTPVTKDRFGILTEKKMYEVPSILHPKTIHNQGNYLISLSQLTTWLGEQAEELEVDVLPGFAADQVLYNEDGSVGGVITGDFGVGKNGEQLDTYTPGIAVKAKQTILTEGCRGSVSGKVMKNFRLDKGRLYTPSYCLGLKEVWEVDNEHFNPGEVMHTSLWPLTSKEYGGSFIYHMNPGQIHIGFVIGLSYENPYLNPYEEFQRFKTHPEISKILKGGQCIEYGARSLNSGSWHSVPDVSFPGGMIAGCSAGFLNTAAIKGAHLAMKSGMVAADTITENFNELEGKNLTSFKKKIEDSFVGRDLKETRNFKKAFNYGLWAGMGHAFLTSFTKGREPWTIKCNTLCSRTYKKAKECQPIKYPKPDGELTFDLLTNLQRSGTMHEDDQPAHLKVKKGREAEIQYSAKVLAGPETRFCPARVYEHIENESTGKTELVINAQNCLHCKACDIKMPKEYIDWTVPEGGGGPNYSNM